MHNDMVSYGSPAIFANHKLSDKYMCVLYINVAIVQGDIVLGKGAIVIYMYSICITVQVSEKVEYITIQIPGKVESFLLG